MSSDLMSLGRVSCRLLWAKLLIGAGLSFACAGILGIEDAECSDQFNGCPGFEAATGDGGPADTDSGTDNDAGEPEDAADNVDPEALCDEYCGEITDNCVEGADVQYPSYDFCMNVCSHFEIGDPSDQTGNTLYCRLPRARNAASSETALNCQIAGPSGAGVCGESLCDNFCDFEVDICSDEFSSRSACMAECDSLVDRGEYNSGSVMQQGPEQQCRLYHVNAAATDAFVHCRHTGGADPCE